MYGINRKLSFLRIFWPKYDHLRQLRRVHTVQHYGKYGISWEISQSAGSNFALGWNEWLFNHFYAILDNFGLIFFSRFPPPYTIFSLIFYFLLFLGRGGAQFCRRNDFLNTFMQF